MQAPTTDVVEDALERLLASPQFSRSPRARRFLQFVVQAALGGRADGLKEYLVGMEVFDRAASFDPRIDTIPDQTNHYGTLFGGQALSLMDKAAFVAASRFARKTVVTASSERVDFKNPVHHGNLVELTATVVSTGRTSITVSVELFAEDLLSGERQLCAQGRFILVAVDKRGKPVEVCVH